MVIELILGATHRGYEDLLVTNVFHPSTLWIAQAASTDLFSSVSQAWDNFLRTGQVWALIIGFFVGYIFRSITSY